MSKLDLLSVIVAIAKLLHVSAENGPFKLYVVLWPFIFRDHLLACFMITQLYYFGIYSV